MTSPFASSHLIDDAPPGPGVADGIGVPPRSFRAA